MNDLIDKIHDIPIEDGIGRYITIKQKGTSFEACCPFHDEKTPSFKVSPAKGIFNCFGCGVKGDLIAFVMEYEKLDFAKALFRIADQHGIQYETPEFTDEQRSAAEEKSKDRIEIFAINKTALEYFQSEFLKSKETARYTYKRVDHCLPIMQWKIGYATGDWQGFYKYAKAKGHTFAVMEKAGLCRQGQNRKFDVFRNRLIFPIRNPSGAIIGFGGRDLSGEKEAPKYLNTFENAVYNKSKALYGIDRAQKSIRLNKEVHLVEGYTDVIRMHWLGVDNTVAFCGTAVTSDHAKEIKRYTKTVNLIFDGDIAGRNAANRAGELLTQCGLNVGITLLPGKQDPAEFFQIDTTK